MSRAAARRRLAHVLWLDRALVEGGADRIARVTAGGGNFTIGDHEVAVVPGEVLALAAIPPGPKVATLPGGVRAMRLAPTDEWFLWIQIQVTYRSSGEAK